MEKELKILFITILTMIFYGVFLLIDGKPFYVYPLNVMANFSMTLVIVITMRKFDWRNLVYLSAAFLLLFQDPLFLSFFHIEAREVSDDLDVFAIVGILVVNLMTFIPILEKERRRLMLGLLVFSISVFSFLEFGVYGTLISSILGLFLASSSKKKEIEFLKVYSMFFIFMLLNQIITLNIY